MDFRITHGMCPRCKAKGAKQLDLEMDHFLFLKRSQAELMQVGERGDVQAAATVIEMAKSWGIRPVEMLIGLIAPLLYVIGEGWEQGKVSVAEEHRFTLFCEDVFRLVDEAFQDKDVEAQDSRGLLVVLLNAYGNEHTLATRILALWLKAKGFDALVLDPPPPPAVLSATLRNLKPTAVLISLALSEQRTADGIVTLQQRPPSRGIRRRLCGQNGTGSTHSRVHVYDRHCPDGGDASTFEPVLTQQLKLRNR